MSQRNMATDNDRAVHMLRELHERVGRLEAGGAIRGEISLDDKIHIGGAQVEVRPADGDDLEIVFTNPTTGATHTISL